VSEVVLTQQRGATCWITISRPEQRNALNADVAAGIVAALDAAEADGDVRAVVLTGSENKAFCAGGDLKPGAEGTPFSLDAHDPRHYVAGLLRRMEDCRLPLIARVNGHALAGGFGLVCACDMAVVRDDALLGVSEVKVGLFPMMILPFLMRVLPQRVLAEMCLTGEPITGAEAFAHGIVNRAVPADRLDAETDAVLARVVDKSPTGIRLGKQALCRIREMTFDAAMEYAPLMLANMARTEDAREGFAAFAEKRAPKWTGR
jgi:enoyl-CoA hydratase/carnithine racemase